MALDARKLGHTIAANLREHRFRKPRPFWHHIWDDVVKHIRTYMDLWEVVELVTVDEDTASYVVPLRDIFLIWHTAATKGPYTVTLPPEPFTGQYVVVKDGGGAASSDKIRVDPGAKFIDGTAGIDEINTNYFSITYLYDDIEWHRLTSGGASTGDLFAAQQIESISTETTASTSAQDAFLGESPDSITIAADGDYLIYFETSYLLSNNNGVARIGVGKNGINFQVGSTRSVGGNKNGSAITIKRLDGLVVGDVIRGTYSMAVGGGSISVFEKSMSVIRIAS